MTKTSLRLITTLFVTLLLLTACNEANPEPEQTLDENQESEQQQDIGANEKEDATDTEPVTSDSIVLPIEELQKGEQGEDVQNLQRALIAIGYPIEETGTYDHHTTWAITDLQLQHDHIHTTGMYNAETKTVIENVLAGGTEMNNGSKLSKPTQKGEGKRVVENPYEILSLVNKEYALPSDYIPEDLVIPNVRFSFVEDLPKKQLRKVAAEALEALFEDADGAGLELFAVSGYRSYDRQDAIFASNANKHGEEAANRFSARPGESEHQTGLTMDVSSPAVNFNLVIEFGETDEGQWLKKHASDYGFIIRYPEGKEDITQYQYEPWHLRYIGKKAAKEIMDNGLTLEEYLEE